MNLSLPKPGDRGRGFKLARTAAGWGIAAACIAYLALQVRGSADALNDMALKPAWVVLAVLCVVAGQAVNGLITHRLLRTCAGRPRWTSVLRIHLMSQIAKYLPAGGVLNVTAQTMALGRLPGVGVPHAVSAVTLMTVLACAGAACFQGLARLTAGAGMSWASAGGVVCLPVAALLIVHPAGVSKLRSLLSSRLAFGADHPETAGPALMLFRVASFSGLALLSWLLMGLGAIAVAAQADALSVNVAVQLAGAFAFSWLIGFLALVAPGGLGVREVSLMLMLEPLLPPPWPAVFPIISRLAWVAADGLCFILGWACMRRSCKDQPIQPLREASQL